jgi:hypothetical protein
MQRLPVLKRWHLVLRQELTELALLFRNVSSIAVVRSEGGDLLFVHGSKPDLESL